MDLRSRKYYFAALLSSMTLAVYLPALQNDFVNWDDDLYVYNNQNIRSLDWPFLRWAFTSFHAGNWHPLTWVSHALDYALWGLNPLGHHLTSIVFHALNTGLVALLVMRLTGLWRERTVPTGVSSFLDERGSLIAAGVTTLLFGLHPLHVESAVWVAERKDLLCAFFFLLSVMAYARFAGGSEEAGTGRGGWTARFLRKGSLPSLALFALALMSKPMAVSLPVVLLLLDWFPFRRIPSWRTFRDACIEKLLFLVLTFASVIVTMMAQRDAMWTAVPLSVRMLVAAKALVMYLYKMLMPVNLMPVYPYSRDTMHYLSFEFAAAVLLVTGITIISLKNMKKDKLWPASWGYYLSTLMPVLGIVQVGSQSMADRYAYLPSLGPFLLGGLGAAWVVAKASVLKQRGLTIKPILYAAALTAIIILSTMTLNQITVWKNSISLWNYVIEENSVGIPVAYYNRGLAFKEAGKLEHAISDLTRAISFRPSDPDAFINRGAALKGLGRFEEALADFNAAIVLRPSYYSAYMNRGLALEEIGWFDEANADYTTAIALNPYHGNAYLSRGTLYLKTGNPELALQDFQTACELGNEEGCESLTKNIER